MIYNHWALKGTEEISLRLMDEIWLSWFGWYYTDKFIRRSEIYQEEVAQEFWNTI